MHTAYSFSEQQTKQINKAGFSGRIGVLKPHHP